MEKAIADAAKKAGVTPRARPALYVVPAASHEEQAMDATERRWHIRMICHMRSWSDGNSFLIDQAGGAGGLEQLSDKDLLALRKQLDRARECMAYGMSPDESEFVRAIR